MIAGANGITKAHAWPPKYIRDYLVLSRDPRTDQLISTFAKVPLTHGLDRFIIAREEREEFAGANWRFLGPGATARLKRFFGNVAVKSRVRVRER